MQMKCRRKLSLQKKTQTKKNPKTPGNRTKPQQQQHPKNLNQTRTSVKSETQCYSYAIWQCRTQYGYTVKCFKSYIKGKTDCNEQCISEFRQILYFKSMNLSSKRLFKISCFSCYTPVSHLCSKADTTSGPFPGKPRGGAEGGYLWLQGSILMAHTLILPFVLKQICCIHV